ncbi:MAG TPA: FlgD immunoglobulin-like domain containing protein [Candidatus Krumholzibacteria bacterium]|nr:FlgD immunoglobulin-like domain containing protein [Candidatus Krumholzibacteria bacterium]
MKLSTRFPAGLALILCLALALPALAADFVFKQEFGQVQPRGGAQIQNPADGPLRVSNLGSSGQDGVRIATGNGGNIGPIRWMAPESLPGRGLNVIVDGEDPVGIPCAFATSFTFDDLGRVSFSFDPLTTPVTQLEVRLYANGNPVFSTGATVGASPLFESSAPPGGFGGTGPYLPLPPYDDSIFGWIFPGGTQVGLPGQSPMACDMVTFAFPPSMPEVTLLGAEILGLEPQGAIGELLITEHPSTLFHHAFGALGGARPQMVDNLGSSGQDGVRVSNLGSSGQDGVCIALNPDDTGLGVHLVPMEATPGDVLRFGGLSLSEQPQGRTPLPTITCEYTADSFFDIWTEVGAADEPSVLRYTLDGAVVAEIQAPRGPARVWTLQPDKTSVQHPYRLEMHAVDGPGFRVEIEFPEPMRCVDGNGGDQDCDGVELEFDAPIGGPWYDWDAIELAALLILLGDLDIDGCPNGTGGWTGEPIILDAARGIEKSDIRRGADGALHVDNLGSSGQDGVRLLAPGGGTGSGLGAAWLSAAPLDPFRGHVTVLKAHGGGGGGGGGGVIVVATAPADPDTNPGEWNVGADFSALGPDGVTYNVYDQGQLVASVICAGTIEECLGLTAAPVSCDVVVDHPDGRPRMRLGLPPLTDYIDRSSPLLGTGPADEIEVLFNAVPATPWTQITALDLLLGGVDGELTVASAGVTDSSTSASGPAPLADALTLRSPSPNPFNPSTEIAFELTRAAHVTLQVFDLRGQMVRELVRGARPAGEFRTTWNGLDGGGRPVASGTYVFRLSVGGEVQMRKGALLK